MKKISIRIILAFLTFSVGISFTTFWLLNSKLPDVPIPASQQLRNSNFTTHSRISKQRKKFWENELLPRFKESPLEISSSEIEETYRFVLLPTFDAPIAIRVWRSGNKYFMTTKKTNGEGGFGMNKFGTLSYEKTRPLTKEEWDGFLTLLDEAMFWDMLLDDKNDLPVEDGASWIMEGYSNQNYHSIDRITPNKEFGKICIYLLKLSSFEADYKGYYSSN